MGTLQARRTPSANLQISLSFIFQARKPWPGRRKVATNSKPIQARACISRDGGTDVSVAESTKGSGPDPV